MERDRFKDLFRILRFDDCKTRAERKSREKMAAFREIFTIFVRHCQDNYNPCSHLTSDEQLVPFRGRCPFSVYMKSKPAKYGIKIWIMSDTETAYAKNLQIYLGKRGDKPEVNQGQRVVLDLVSCLDKGYGITVDNFFISLPLAKELLLRDFTLFGTLRKNKRDIPDILQPNKSKRSCHLLSSFKKTPLWSLLSLKKPSCYSVID